MTDQFEPKLTEEHKAFIHDCIDKGMTNKDTYLSLLKEFDLSKKFISQARVGQIAAKRRKANKKARRSAITSTSDDNNTQVVGSVAQNGSQEDNALYRDLRAILMSLMPKNKAKVDTMVYAWENTSGQDVWKLLKIMDINNLSPIVQRQVILQYYGLETVQKIWVDAEEIDTPTVKKDVSSEVDSITEQMMKQLKGKIAYAQLKAVSYTHLTLPTN